MTILEQLREMSLYKLILLCIFFAMLCFPFIGLWVMSRTRKWGDLVCSPAL